MVIADLGSGGNGVSDAHDWPTSGVRYAISSGKTGQALSARALGNLVKRYALQARLADVSPNDLRHRFGYRMAEVVPLHRLTQIMGHDSLDTTMTHIRATKTDLQQGIEKIAWM
jgi:integrase/recombinase XerC